ELISDALTLLAQPFDGHRVGAAVIERKTTQAELYFIFDDVRSESEAFTVLTREDEAPSVEALTLAGVASAFALSVVSGFGNQVGAAIFDQIFGSKEPPEYFDAVYKKLALILREEIERNNRETVADKMGGLQAWHRDRYWPWKRRDNPPVAELYAALKKRLKPFYDGTVQILERDHNRGPGALVYLASSGYYFAMLQEMALVNPDHQNNVHEAPENDGIRAAAISHYRTLVDTWNRVHATRNRQIRVFKTPHWVAPWTCKITAEDQLTGDNHYKHWYCNNQLSGPAEREVWAECQRWARARYLTEVQSLYDQMGKPLEIAHNWAMLSLTPLPLPRNGHAPMIQYLYAVTDERPLPQLWVTRLKPSHRQDFKWTKIGHAPFGTFSLAVHRGRLYASSNNNVYEREPAIADLPWRLVSRKMAGAMVAANKGKELWSARKNALEALGPFPDLLSLGEPTHRRLSGPQHSDLRCLGLYEFAPESHRLVGISTEGAVFFSDVGKETTGAEFQVLSQDGGKAVVDLTQWQLDSGQTHVYAALEREIYTFAHERGTVGIKVGDAPGSAPLKAIGALTVPFPEDAAAERSTCGACR
ncbi:MAG: hypothetical protein AAF657_33075, partial [Acidobacteriota bacterium]